MGVEARDAGTGGGDVDPGLAERLAAAGDEIFRATDRSKPATVGCGEHGCDPEVWVGGAAAGCRGCAALLEAFGGPPDAYAEPGEVFIIKLPPGVRQTEAALREWLESGVGCRGVTVERAVVAPSTEEEDPTVLPLPEKKRAALLRVVRALGEAGDLEEGSMLWVLEGAASDLLARDNQARRA